MILIDVYSPFDTNLKELSKEQRIHRTEVGLIAKLLGAMHLLTSVRHTIIVNYNLKQ